MKNFRALKIWQKGVEIAILSFKLTQAFPKEERFGISSQITRAAVSIPSNIAEGSSRASEKDYGRFLQIALGSAFELETQLIIAERANFGDQKSLIELIGSLNEAQKMISSFIRQLENHRFSS